jgi:hypothetical protein
MAGVDSAGLGEVLQNVLAGFPDSDKSRFAQVSIYTIYYSSLVFTDTCYLECLRHRFTVPFTQPYSATAKHPSADPAPRDTT